MISLSQWCFRTSSSHQLTPWWSASQALCSRLPRPPSSSHPVGLVHASPLVGRWMQRQFVFRSELWGTSIPTQQWRIWLSANIPVQWLGTLCEKPNAFHGRLLFLVFSQFTHSDVWNELWHISGKCSCTSVTGISAGSANIKSKVDFVNTPESIFASVFSSVITVFPLNFKKTAQKPLPLNFAFWPAMLYSAQFSMDELLAILDCCHSTSLGPNGIYNQMLSRLPPTHKVLYYPNTTVCGQRTLPQLPGDSHSLPTCYRSVMLTRCMYKTMEWMVNHWLIWILEDRNLLSNTLCHRSTLDHPMNMEHHIQNFSSCTNTVTQSSSWNREDQQSFLTFEAENHMPVFQCLCCYIVIQAHGLCVTFLLVTR
jgi:hypothetical protein